jgi:hypothetical protein
MTPKEKAHEIIQMHLVVQIDSGLPPNIMLYVAKQNALVTAKMMLRSRPGYPYPHEVGANIKGLDKIIAYPGRYWAEVWQEIEVYENTGYIIANDPDRITCLTCNRTSYNSNDVANLFCGFCEKFHNEEELLKR